MDNLQAIFSVKHGDKWLYYVRETVNSNAHAESMARDLSYREQRHVRVVVQNWSNIQAADHCYIAVSFNEESTR